jgi:MFS transporter, DHA1 family, inner membrane transport protein
MPRSTVFALISLCVAAFSIGTTEFIIAGLLPDIAGDLKVSVPAAGLLITAYAAGVAVGGPVISLVTARFSRKPTIVLLMAIFIGGNVLCALAPSYGVLVVARVVISFSHGSFFGLAAIIAVSLVPATRRSFALSLVFSGISVANIIGVPLGTLIGHSLGWRASFWIISVVALLATAAMLALLPNDAAAAHADITVAEQFRVLVNPQIYLTYLAIVLMMIGFFSFFTFIAPFLTEVTGIAEQNIAAMLLLFGVGATVGIFSGGRLGDWRPGTTLLAAFPLQAAAFAAILLLSNSTAAMAVLLFVLGAVVIVTQSPLQNHVLSHAAAAPNLASTLIPSVFNAGIAIGTWLGFIALSKGAHYSELPWLGVVCSLAAGGVITVVLAMERRSRRVVTVRQTEVPGSPRATGTC